MLLPSLDNTVKFFNELHCLAPRLHYLAQTQKSIEKEPYFVIIKSTGAPTPLTEVSNGSTFLF